MSRAPVIEGKEIMSVYKHKGNVGMWSAELEFASYSFAVPTVASLVNAMQQSKEKVLVKGKSLLKKKVREFLLNGILIEKER
jgi:hypothetical protein